MAEQAVRDQNHVPSMLFMGSDGLTYNAQGDEATGRLKVDTAAGSGTVTSVSVVSANGFAGTVADATTTPAITLSTTITGILKGNGTAISAVTVGTGLAFDGTTLSSTITGTVTSVAMTVPTGLTITGSPVTTNGTLAVALDTGYVIPLQSTLDGKANTALSNLASVAINTSLISDTTNTDDIGASGTTWRTGYFGTSLVIGATNTITSTTSDLTGGALTLGTLLGTIDAGGATSLEIPNSAAPTVNADGEIAVDTTVADFSLGVIKFFGGEEQGVVSMPVAQFTTPVDGAVPTYVASADEFQMVVPSGGGGDNVVFVPAGAFVPGANCTLTVGTTTAWIPVVSFADGAQGRATLSVKVPAGCAGITSIEVIYQNEVGSTLQLYLEYETSSLNLDSLPSAVNSDTNGGVAQYASDSTVGNIAKVTVPAAAYNGLTNTDAGDLITMRINREGANANDTYDTAWTVIGVVFTFTEI